MQKGNGTLVEPQVVQYPRYFKKMKKGYGNSKQPYVYYMKEINYLEEQTLQDM